MINICWDKIKKKKNNKKLHSLLPLDAKRSDKPQLNLSGFGSLS